MAAGKRKRKKREGAETVAISISLLGCASQREGDKDIAVYVRLYYEGVKKKLFIVLSVVHVHAPFFSLLPAYRFPRALLVDRAGALRASLAAVGASKERVARFLVGFGFASAALCSSVSASSAFLLRERVLRVAREFVVELSVAVVAFALDWLVLDVVVVVVALGAVFELPAVAVLVAVLVAPWLVLELIAPFAFD
jgi:hypothetical protein